MAVDGYTNIGFLYNDAQSFKMEEMLIILLQQRKHIQMPCVITSI